jgi:hypothetical protein
VATPRQTIAAALRTDNPTWNVFEWPADLTEVRKPTAVVYRTTLAPAIGSLVHEVKVQMYGTKAIGAGSEDELDNLLDAVMLSMQKLAGVTVKEAVRKTFSDVFQGWELDVVWHSSDIYKAQV